MRYWDSLAAILPIALVAASPASSTAPALSSTVNKCSPYSTYINSLSKIAPTATSFCSSYLGIKTATVSSTSTITPIPSTATTTVTVTLSTVTSTITNTQTATATATSTTYVTTTPSTTITTTSFSATSFACASTGGTLAGSLSTSSTLAPAKRGITTSTVKSVPTPSCLTGKPNTLISSVCSCLNIPTPTFTSTVSTTLAPKTNTVTSTATLSPTATTTVTTTVTNTVTSSVTSTVAADTVTYTNTYVQPTPAVFNGINWYYYVNNYNFDLANPGEDATTFQNPNYLQSGTVGNINQMRTRGFGTSNPSSTITLPNGYTGDGSHASAVMQGYFYAPLAGNYTFSTDNNVDNYLALWFGDKAYGNNWNNNNADFKAKRAGYDSSQWHGDSHTFSLAAGEFFPLTFLWINGGGIGGFYFTLTTPDGVPHSDTTGYFIPPCDANNQFVP